MATKLYDGKISGRTSTTTDGTATGIVATLAIELWDDGWCRWTDANGDRHSFPMSGEVSALMKTIFTGVGAPAQAFFG